MKVEKLHKNKDYVATMALTNTSWPEIVLPRSEVGESVTLLEKFLVQLRNEGMGPLGFCLAPVPRPLPPGHVFPPSPGGFHHLPSPHHPGLPSITGVSETWSSWL